MKVIESWKTIHWLEVLAVSAIVGGVDYAHELLVHYNYTISAALGSASLGLTAGWGALVYSVLVWARQAKAGGAP